MKGNKLIKIFFIFTIISLIIHVGVILVFSTNNIISSFYSALSVSTTIIAFSNMITSCFFSLGIYNQSKAQIKINDKLPKKDDQYIINNYSLFNIEGEFSVFNIDQNASNGILASVASAASPSDKFIRLVFLPTQTINAPIYKVFVKDIAFANPSSCHKFSNKNGAIDTQYSQNILMRGYNCICIDIALDSDLYTDIFNESNSIILNLQILSIFNVYMDVKYEIFIDSQKDTTNNPDKKSCQDLETWLIHHSIFIITDKGILPTEQ